MHSEYVLEDWRIPEHKGARGIKTDPIPEHKGARGIKTDPIPEHEGARGIKTGEYQSMRVLVESGIQSRVPYSYYLSCVAWILGDLIQYNLKSTININHMYHIAHDHRT